MKDAAVKFLSPLCCWFGAFLPPPLSRHGQFHLPFTTAVFPTQFLYLSQGIQSLGVHWNSLNIISNMWQEFTECKWDEKSNWLRESYWDCALGRACMMDSCNYRYKLQESWRWRRWGKSGGEGDWGTGSTREKRGVTGGEVKKVELSVGGWVLIFLPCSLSCGCASCDDL